jgi:hypothetical protein
MSETPALNLALDRRPTKMRAPGRSVVSHWLDPEQPSPRPRHVLYVPHLHLIACLP